ncbi:MAG TPA: hypothetical protein VND22_08720 [Actinomycetota bacterium]|nr:hypothetical protein [Actinomycetota bacterium]
MTHFQFFVARVADRYSAHLGDGGPLSAFDIGLIVIGSAIAIGGFLLLNMKPSSVTGPGKFKKLGAPLLGIGLCIVAFGPGLIQHNGDCVQTPQNAEIEILSPHRHEVTPTQVRVRVETSGAGLEDLWSSEDRLESAHLRLLLDGKVVSRVDAAVQIVDAVPGDHELVAELVSSNNKPFCDRVTDEVKFAVVE